MTAPPPGREAIALAEKVISLFDEGQFVATYKHAVLLGILDLCLEKTAADGSAPEMITTRELAESVLRIYWPHCTPYQIDGGGLVLRQSGGGRNAQAEILRHIVAFRDDYPLARLGMLARLPGGGASRYRRLVDTIEWKLIEMPLPRLQRLGNRYDEFLYSIAWGEDVAYREVRAYQRGAPSSFDNRIMLRPGVGEHLVILNGLLRPLIHREWAALVARMNRLEEARLEAFLFGSRRIVLRPVVDGLRELQDDRCFYCAERLLPREGRRPDVDHFIPWSRYPNDAIQNLVIAHQGCNIHKSDFLAAADHVSHWIERLDQSGEDLARIASSVGWETDRERTLGVARGVYNRLPEDIPLWVLRREFAADLPQVRPLLKSKSGKVH